MRRSITAGIGTGGFTKLNQVLMLVVTILLKALQPGTPLTAVVTWALSIIMIGTRMLLYILQTGCRNLIPNTTIHSAQFHWEIIQTKLLLTTCTQDPVWLSAQLIL